ncbi:MAG: hypothetical protein AB7K24_22880 [Gemmataceae bacterium]
MNWVKGALGAAALSVLLACGCCCGGGKSCWLCDKCCKSGSKNCKSGKCSKGGTCSKDGCAVGEEECEPMHPLDREQRPGNNIRKPADAARDFGVEVIENRKPVEGSVEMENGPAERRHIPGRIQGGID